MNSIGPIQISAIELKFSINAILNSGRSPIGRSRETDAGYVPSASLYIAEIVENLFGIDYDVIQKRLTIAPYIPSALYGRELRIENLVLPHSQEARLSVSIRQTSPTTAKISTEISGPLPEAELEIALPRAAQST